MKRLELKPGWRDGIESVKSLGLSGNILMVEYSQPLKEEFTMDFTKPLAERMTISDKEKPWIIGHPTPDGSIFQHPNTQEAILECKYCQVSGRTTPVLRVPPDTCPPPETTAKHTLAGGATRAPGYFLIPRAGLRRTALCFDLGAEKHGPWNWLRSVQTEGEAYAFAVEAYNHLLEHTLKMGNGEAPEDDHLGAIGWSQSLLAFIEEKFGRRWTDLGPSLKTMQEAKQ